MSKRSPKERRFMLLGDRGTGKTSLLDSAGCVTSASSDATTVYFKFLRRAEGKREILLHFWDMPGGEPVPARDAVFPNLHAAIIVFSLNDAVTLENARRKWFPEVRSKCGKKIPIVLVGNKQDLREQTADSVTFEQGLKVAEKIHAYAYVECCANDLDSCLQVFHFAIMAVVKRSSCSVM